MIMWQDLTGNLPIKLLALVLAVALWLLANGAREAEKDLLVPVLVKNLPRDLTVACGLPRSIAVTVSGPKYRLLGLHPENMAVPLDLKDLGEGTALFGGMDKRLSLPPGVTVMRVYPAAVEVRLQRPSRQGTH